MNTETEIETPVEPEVAAIIDPEIAADPALAVEPEAPATPERPEYQQRVLDEKAELGVRLDNLRGYRATATFRELPKIEQQALTTQLTAMTLYWETLSARVSRF